MDEKEKVEDWEKFLINKTPAFKQAVLFTVGYWFEYSWIIFK